MGRYSTDITSANAPMSNSGQSTGQQMNNNWPTTFNKPVVALDLNGVIIEDKLLNTTANIVPIQGSLDAIRALRLKGHKVSILSDQPAIMQGNMNTDHMDAAVNQLMQIFGQAGIMTIDGLLYNTSSLNNDEYAKPNVGMVKRIYNDTNGAVDLKKGWYVGDSIEDLKMADNAGAKPVLVLSGNGEKTLKELDRNSNRALKKKTQVYNTLLDFANTL